MNAPSICSGNGLCDPRVPHICYLPTTCDAPEAEHPGFPCNHPAPEPDELDMTAPF